MAAPDRSGGIPPFRTLSLMKQHRPLQLEEPVGIVISRGREPETPPRFAAYVWAPYPEDEMEKEARTA